MFSLSTAARPNELVRRSAVGRRGGL